MRIRQIIGAQPVGLVLGFCVASVLFMAAFGLALTTGRVLATHDGTGNVHACLNPFNGQARFFYPGQTPNCMANEIQIDLASGAAAAGIDARLDELEERLACVRSAPGANPEVDDIVFRGCNVQVVNGLNNTLTTNEVGNLIVGYNEDYMLAEDRSGSHNLVVGPNHTYSSYGGLVAGVSSNVTAPHASVSGGNSNTASGAASSVSAGNSNTASGLEASVSGGSQNVASGERSSVSGGQNRSTDNANPNFDWRGGGLIQDN